MRHPCLPAPIAVHLTRLVASAGASFTPSPTIATTGPTCDSISFDNSDFIFSINPAYTASSPKACFGRCFAPRRVIACEHNDLLNTISLQAAITSRASGTQLTAIAIKPTIDHCATTMGFCLQIPVVSALSFNCTENGRFAANRSGGPGRQLVAIDYGLKTCLCPAHFRIRLLQTGQSTLLAALATAFANGRWNALRREAATHTANHFRYISDGRRSRAAFLIRQRLVSSEATASLYRCYLLNIMTAF